jgi:ligand-binding sensor domain-containing protein/signal transduction histidine kinase
MGSARRIAWRFIAACVAVGSGCALALDPSLDVSQYAHTAWRFREGFAKSAIESIAQTPDGYLWFGTEAGLARFDGVRSVPWQPRAGEALPDAHVRLLLAAHDGTLWIGTFAGLASLARGALTSYPRLDGSVINGLAEDREGTIWVGARTFEGEITLCTIARGDRDCRDAPRLDPPADLLYSDSRGRVWAANRSGVWRLSPGPLKAFPLPTQSNFLMMTEDADGALLVAAAAGIRRIVGDRVEPYTAPGIAPDLRAISLLRDRDGALWIRTEEGLVHLHQGRMDRFGRKDGFSDDRIERMFEDREGNIWLTTSEGVDRFREYAVTRLSVEQGLASSAVTSVAISRDGGVWIGSRTGVDRLAHGAIENVRAPVRAGAGLMENSRGRTWIGGPGGVGYLDHGRFVALPGVSAGLVDAFAEDRHGNVWIAHRDAGLLRWSADHGIERTPWTALSVKGGGVRIAVDPSRDGLWLGSPSGVVYVEQGRVRESYRAKDGLGRDRVRDLRFDSHGALWASTDGGVSRIKDGRIATLGARNGLSCEGVDWSIDDDAGSTWLYTDCGLLRIARADIEAWAATADRGQGTEYQVHVTVMDASDGLAGSANVGTFSPHVAKGVDGRLWFVTRSGIAVVDPAHIRRNALAPPVHIETVEADHEVYENAGTPLRLPPLVRDVHIRYVALSYAAPEKVRFRYMLEGRDPAWMDVGGMRRASYTDLPPGDYRFRVVAANNSGVWNEQGDALAFSIAPAWWQTAWFRASLVLAIVLLLCSAYRLRVAHIAQRFNDTLDARVNERMRIARELHDTLLQSFHGLLLRFQTVAEMLPERATEAKQQLLRTIDQAAEAVAEGRDAVQGLRASAIEVNDLANAIRELGETLATEQGNGDAPELRVDVQGVSRPLHPILRDEIFRIACEAVRNAFRHSGAKRIEVEIRYDARQLRVRVRDDGKGMDAKLLGRGGREGHFGLNGMRERAKLAGGKLAIFSTQGEGTEVELAIPASHAYVAPAGTGDSVTGEKVHGA